MDMEMRYLHIDPREQMVSTGTGRDGGCKVLIVEKNLRGHVVKSESLPHAPFSDGPGITGFHSPDGFQIGYAGSGPSDLAFAICAYLRPRDVAQRIHQDFKNRFIVPMDRHEQYEFNLDTVNVIVTECEKKAGVLSE